MDGLPLRVLLVDDDEDDFVITRELLREISPDRFSLEWVANYDDAIQAIERRGHELYLFYYRLGRRNGVELLHHTINCNYDAPGVLLTRPQDRDADLQPMKTGAADHLVKSQ